MVAARHPNTNTPLAIVRFDDHLAAPRPRRQACIPRIPLFSFDGAQAWTPYDHRSYTLSLRVVLTMVRQVSSGSVQPLRIAKHSHSSSSSATAPASSSSKMASPRPLAEIANSSPRRNSPSYNQATRVSLAITHAGKYDDVMLTAVLHAEDDRIPRILSIRRQSGDRQIITIL